VKYFFLQVFSARARILVKTMTPEETKLSSGEHGAYLQGLLEKGKVNSARTSHGPLLADFGLSALWNCRRRGRSNAL